MIVDADHPASLRAQFGGRAVELPLTGVQIILVKCSSHDVRTHVEHVEEPAIPERLMVLDPNV
ncbi:MAG: hypothetical protein EHM61_11625 [Acidobacteria bacterium]|nr:MAG: hypothetical protein EHM61_11625 [Acidobacteriota bacterium]